MGHNVWMHIESVQRANRKFDSGERPAMLWHRNGDHTKFEDIVEAIFSAPDRASAEAIIDHYDHYWMDIIGTRGFKGKKTKNANTMFNALFEPVYEDIDDMSEDEAVNIMQNHLEE